jgi:hypothetical protein
VATTVPDLYPELESRWDAANKLQHWAIPAVDAISDVVAAIELTGRYHPLTGLMVILAS